MQTFKELIEFCYKNIPFQSYYARNGHLFSIVVDTTCKENFFGEMSTTFTG
jgi:hypothetical protein